MKMTVVLFQIDFDRFSAMAVDLDHQGNVWRTTFDSRRDLLRTTNKSCRQTRGRLEPLRFFA